MSPQDAFGREIDEDVDTPHLPGTAPAPRRSGPPRWLVWMVAVDALIAVAVIVVVLAA